MSEIKKVKLPNDSTIYDIDATTVNGHTVDIDVPNIVQDLPTGPISTVTDAAELPLNALKVSVEAWQEGSGDPSPSNIRPIHGWDSGIVNVSRPNLYVDGTIEFKQAIAWQIDNTINVPTITGMNANGNVINGTPSTSYFWMHIPFKFTKNRTIYLLLSETPTPPSKFSVFRISDSSGAYITYIPTKDQYTPSEDFEGFIDLGFDSALFTNYKIGIGYTPTFDIDAYNKKPPKTYTIQLGQTIYGAEWDVANGNVNETDIIVDLSDLTWTKQSMNNANTGRIFQSQSILTIKVLGQGLSNAFKFRDYASLSGWAWEDLNLNEITVGINYILICIQDNYADTTEVQAFLSQIGAELETKLATPTTIDLSPLSIRLLEGNNNLYADCGEVIEGEYFVDSELTDGISAVAEVVNTDSKVTQTEIPTGNIECSLVFAKDHSDTTNTDGLYKSSKIQISQSAYNNKPMINLSNTDEANVATQAVSISDAGMNVMKRQSASDTPKYISVSSDDISFRGGDTWDGTHTSLKTTLANIDAKNVIMAASSTDERMHVLVNANNHTSGEADVVKYGSFFYNPSTNAIGSIPNTSATDGNESFAWGESTAIGDYSQAMGQYTAATHKCQHVFGMCSVEDPSTAGSDEPGTYIEIVGNGISYIASNARTLDWSGNEWIAGTLTQGSSKKIKKNISPITDDEISKVLELNGVKFDYVKTGTDNQAERGFIAEEVAKVLPNLVTEEWTDDNGNLLKPASLNYLAIIPYLVEICKKQQEEIDELKQKIKE